jgi:ABC-type antimicrobial peptide transport system permease subunit
MAIGSDRAGIQKMILREMGLIIVLGLLLGLPPAISISKTVETMLFGLHAYDATVIAGASLLLVLCGFFAAYLPARRASRIDPLRALQCD